MAGGSSSTTLVGSVTEPNAQSSAVNKGLPLQPSETRIRHQLTVHIPIFPRTITQNENKPAGTAAKLPLTVAKKKHKKKRKPVLTDNKQKVSRHQSNVVTAFKAAHRTAVSQQSSTIAEPGSDTVPTKPASFKSTVLSQGMPVNANSTNQQAHKRPKPHKSVHFALDPVYQSDKVVTPNTQSQEPRQQVNEGGCKAQKVANHRDRRGDAHRFYMQQKMVRPNPHQQTNMNVRSSSKLPAKKAYGASTPLPRSHEEGDHQPGSGLHTPPISTPRASDKTAPPQHVNKQDHPIQKPGILKTGLKNNKGKSPAIAAVKNDNNSKSNQTVPNKPPTGGFKPSKSYTNRRVASNGPGKNELHQQIQNRRNNTGLANAQATGNSAQRKNRKTQWAKPPKGNKYDELLPEGSSSPVDDWPVEPPSDPNAPEQLLGWDGNWCPPPIWSDRPDFFDPDFKSTIEKWAKELHATVANAEGSEDISRTKPFLSSKNSAIAPRCWIPASIEGYDLKFWWRGHLSSSLAPECCNPGDLPFWAEYSSDKNDFLRLPEFPPISMDKHDMEYNTFLRAPCVKVKCDIRIQKMIERRAARYKTHHEIMAFEKKNMLRALGANRPWQPFDPTAPVENPEEEFPTPENDEPAPDLNTTVIEPVLNIYLRFAQTLDSEQITELLNWHLENTVNMPEAAAYTTQAIQSRLETIKSNKLPVIVAVNRATVKKHNRDWRKRNNGLPPREQILGVAWANFYQSGNNNAYENAVDMELYVHNEYLKKNIGNCLFDKLLTILNTGHHLRGTYDWEHDDHYFSSGRRRADKVLCHVPYETADLERYKFMRKWFQGFGFQNCGNLKNVGIKNRKRISTLVFVLNTTDNFDTESKKTILTE